MIDESPLKKRLSDISTFFVDEIDDFFELMMVDLKGANAKVYDDDRRIVAVIVNNAVYIFCVLK